MKRLAMDYRLGRDAVDGDVWLSDPDVVLSSGPSEGRTARRDDPPYEPPRQRLGFAPPPSCERPDCCDLSCVWPGERDPQRWEGDDA